MEKLNMQTTDVVDENIKRIGELFPNCLTEVKDEKGRPQVAIDFDQLRQELSKSIVEGPEERYQFTWPDKRNAIRLANAPTTDTLRPCREESVDFDNTQNLYIEGDNLEVLKLLRENYLGKVKMIYIDPPYNTGNDFVYNDDFAQTTDEYIHNSGQEDEEGNRLVANTENNGRFHTDWLNMIYPRLKVAKDLLTEDGVIFISIDDNEVENLKKICDEIFGEVNYVSSICVETSSGLFGLKAKFANTTIVKSKDYILVYKKSSVDNNFCPLYIPSKKLFDTHFTFYKNDEYECSLNEFLQNNKEICYRAKSIGVKPSVDNLHLLMSTFASVNDIIMNEVNHIYRIREYTLKLNDNEKETLQDGHKHLISGNYVFFDENKSPLYLFPFSKVVHKADDYFGKKCSCVIQGDLWKGFNEDMGNIGKEGDVKYENGKKPVRLIKNIAKFINDKDCIILDFFSGSATSAHSVMQMNSEDGGHRRFIMVQLPENLDDSLQRTSGEGQKAIKQSIHFLDSIKKPHFLSEIGKERIRRAGKKIKEESPLTTQDLDTGFRVLKLDSSNMQDIYYTPADFNERELFEDNIKEGRTDEDLLFQAMIELGIELSAKIEKKEIAGKTVWKVSDGYLLACFDENVNETTITEIAKQKPYYFVMRDKSLANDNVADNFEQIFEHYSKDTIRRIL